MTTLLHLLARQNNESDSILIPVPIPIPVPTNETNGVRHGKPVIAFIIGLSIITLASVLNAAGLNLTKLDHVRAAPYQTSTNGNGFLRSCRSDLEPFRKASGRETFHAPYGSLGCYCTCMVSNFSGARP